MSEAAINAKNIPTNIKNSLLVTFETCHKNRVVKGLHIRLITGKILNDNIYWFPVITTYDQVMLKLIFKNQKLKIFATLQIKIGRKKKKTKQMEKIAISYPTESQIKCLSHKLKNVCFISPQVKTADQISRLLDIDIIFISCQVL